MLARLPFLVLLAVATGCGPPVEELKPVFGDAGAMDVIDDATSVSAYRIVQPNENLEALEDFEMAAGPIQVSNALASRLRAILFDPLTYDWDDVSGCLPNYGMRIQFQRGQDVVDLLFCLECDIVDVFHNGECVGGGLFSKGAARLVAIAKVLFPDDEAIQELKSYEE